MNKHHSKIDQQELIQIKGLDLGKEEELFEEIASFGDYSLKDEQDEGVRRVILDWGSSFPSQQFLNNLKNYT